MNDKQMAQPDSTAGRARDADRTDDVLAGERRQTTPARDHVGKVQQRRAGRGALDHLLRWNAKGERGLFETRPLKAR